MDAPIELAPLAEADVSEIRRWPPYSPPLDALDYALRPGGWLDMFPASHANRRFAIRSRGQLVGFSLLVDITSEDAEFYIAIHPQMLGHGIGHFATQAVARVAFDELHLPRIHLKVRVWHRGAMHVYRAVGFEPHSKQVVKIQGEPVDFLLMVLTNKAAPSNNG